MLRLVVVAYGPLLVGALAVYDPVALYHDSLARRTLTRRESLASFLRAYARGTVSVLWLVLLVH